MMGQIELVGKRFGALTVLSFVAASERACHRAGWLVRCDCGKEKVVREADLKRGKITSCGCHCFRGKRQKNQMALFPGQKFSELTAVKPISNTAWVFRCSCGKETTAKIYDVKNGITKSCGHMRKQVKGVFDKTRIFLLRSIINDPKTHGVRAVPSGGGVECWEARIQIRGKEIYLGRYGEYQAAVCARREAEKKYFLPVLQAFDEMKRDKTAEE